MLRSDPQRSYRGEVQRVDLVSDAVSEERIVNVGFAVRPEALSVGELVEVTITVAALANARWLPAAAVKRVDGRQGVWRLDEGRVAFQPVTVAASRRSMGVARSSMDSLRMTSWSCTARRN